MTYGIITTFMLCYLYFVKRRISMEFFKTQGPGILIAVAVAAVSTFLSGLDIGSFS